MIHNLFPLNLIKLFSVLKSQDGSETYQKLDFLPQNSLVLLHKKLLELKVYSSNEYHFLIIETKLF